VGPTCRCHVIVQSVCHIGRLAQVRVIWTSHDTISKFRDLDVHFGSLWTCIAPRGKFKDLVHFTLLFFFILVFFLEETGGAKSRGNLLNKRD
jgi:hypothetical protein